MYNHLAPVEPKFDPNKINDLPGSNPQLPYNSSNLLNIENAGVWSKAVADHGLAEQEEPSIMMDKPLDLPILFIHPGTGLPVPVLCSGTTRNRFTYIKRDANGIPFITSNGMPVICYKTEDNIERQFQFYGADKHIFEVQADKIMDQAVAGLRERYNYDEIAERNYALIYEQISMHIDQTYPNGGYPDLRRKEWERYWRNMGQLQLATAHAGDSRFYQMGGVPDLPIPTIGGVPNKFSPNHSVEELNSQQSDYGHIEGLGGAAGSSKFVSADDVNPKCDLNEIDAHLAGGGTMRGFVDSNGVPALLSEANEDGTAVKRTNLREALGRQSIEQTKPAEGQSVADFFMSKANSEPKAFDLELARVKVEEYVRKMNLPENANCALMEDHFEEEIEKVVLEISEGLDISVEDARLVAHGADVETVVGYVEKEDELEIAPVTQVVEEQPEPSLPLEQPAEEYDFEDYQQLMGDPMEQQDAMEAHFEMMNDADDNAFVEDVQPSHQFVDLGCHGFDTMNTDEVELDIINKVLPNVLVGNMESAVWVAVNAETIVPAWYPHETCMLPIYDLTIASKVSYNKAYKTPLVTVRNGMVCEILVSNEQLNSFGAEEDPITLGDGDGYANELAVVNESDLYVGDEEVLVETEVLTGSLDNIVNRIISTTGRAGTMPIYNAEVALELPGSLPKDTIDKVRADRKENGDQGLQGLVRVIRTLSNATHNYSAYKLDKMVTNYLRNYALIEADSPYMVDNFVVDSEDYLQLINDLNADGHGGVVKRLNTLLNRDFDSIIDTITNKHTEYSVPYSVKEGLDNESIDSITNDSGNLDAETFSITFKMPIINMAYSDVALTTGQVRRSNDIAFTILKSVFDSLKKEKTFSGSILAISADGTVHRIIADYELDEYKFTVIDMF